MLSELGQPIHRWAIPLLLITFGVSRLLLLVGAKPWDESRRASHFVTSDARFYFDTAQNLIEGHGYSESTSPPFLPATTRPPLYSFMLAGILMAVGESITAIVIVQMVLQLATVASLYWILSRDFSPIVAAALCLYSVLDPVYLVMSGYLYSEILYYLLHLAAVAWVVKSLEAGISHGRCLALGGVFGLGLLTRPIGLYLIPFVLLLLGIREGFRRTTIFKVSLVAALTLAVVMPWLLRNYKEYGRFTMASVQGSHLYYRYAAAYVARVEGRSAEEVRAEFAANTPTLDNPFEQSDYLQDQALEVFRRHPLSYAWFHATSALQLFFNANTRALANLLDWDESQFGVAGRDPRSILILMINGILLLGLYLSFVRGLYVLWRIDRPLIGLMLLGGVVYFWLIIGPEASSRYRLSILPFLLFGAAYGLTDLFPVGTSKRWVGRMNRA